MIGWRQANEPKKAFGQGRPLVALASWVPSLCPPADLHYNAARYRFPATVSTRIWSVPNIASEQQAAVFWDDSGEWYNTDAMNPNENLAHLRRQPLEPMRICLSDGSSYEVRHPENALVTRTTVAIAVEPEDGELPKRMVYCDPLHITRVVPVDGPDAKRPSRRRKKP